jgi:hypothetical protein
MTATETLPRTNPLAQRWAETEAAVGFSTPTSRALARAMFFCGAHASAHIISAAQNPDAAKLPDTDTATLSALFAELAHYKVGE